MNPPSHFIFSDPSGNRWPRVQLFLVVGLSLVMTGAVIFIRTLLVNPILSLPPQIREMKGQLQALQQSNPIAQAPAINKLWLKYFHPTYPSTRASHSVLESEIITPIQPANKNIRVGFYVDWDPACFESLAEHASQLTHIVPEWLNLVDSQSLLVDHSNARVALFIKARGLSLMPLLSNQKEEKWQPEAVENLARGDLAVWQNWSKKLLSSLKAMGAGGVVVDWQQIDPTYRDRYTALLGYLARMLHAEHLQLWLTVSTGDEFKCFDLAALSKVVDHFLAQLHDENGEQDTPGPLASQDWFEGWLHVFTSYGEASQWIISIGSYGYDWPAAPSPADSISFTDAMSRAAQAGITSTLRESNRDNPHFAYHDKQGNHQVWFLDVATFLNHWKAARDEGVGGIGVYRLGTEDPGVWFALASGLPSQLPSEWLTSVSLLKSSGVVANVGQGEFLSIDMTQADGKRSFYRDKSGLLGARYLQFPLYQTLYHQGDGTDHEVALSFDDGPDPRWTPRILDILKKYQVSAAFFITGKQAEKYPELVARIVREGHEVGNHTYSHPNLSLVTEEQARLELNATQRIFESITGRSTTLFRPPYNADSQPRQPAELEALSHAQDLGYLTVCENIDPEDWAMPGAEEILERIKAHRHLGSIVLLHDAGGDRSQTVKALPKIIETLKARGDEFVSLGRLLGVPRDQLMPLATSVGPPYDRIVTDTGFRLLHAIEEFLWAFMIVATLLLALRMAIVLFLALRFKPLPTTSHPPAVSILVAAYNEEKVIASTLQSIFQSYYPAEIEVIVVDDGSKDKTSNVVKALFRHESRIRLWQQPNLGKAEALRRALQEARHEIVVFVDADTQLGINTLRELVTPFDEARVGAVSGHAKVGNLSTLIARCQSLEYLCGFNLDRRAYHVCNAITVVPGAISAARRSAIDRVGGLSQDTLAEDTDLTLSLHQHGYRIAYAPAAVAWTEAPETIQSLAKQRFRWAFGTLQCLWKHRDLTFNPRFGWLAFFSLPGIWFFQFALVAVAPLIDLLLIFSLVIGAGGAIFPYFLTFLAFDFILAITACLIEREPWTKALLIIPMRLLYRPLLSWVVWKTLIRAVQGAFVGWGKIDRTASVQLTLNTPLAAKD